MFRPLRFFTAVAFFFSLIDAHAQTTNYTVHSLFVMNIAKYSTWPAQSGDFTITVFGKSKIYDELVKQTAGKTINGMPIKVNQTDNLQELGIPHLVFLADGKSAALEDVLKATSGQATMVIAEREGLYKKGAGFSFVLMENNTLRFDINKAEIEKRQIRVSKNLASLANTII